MEIFCVVGNYNSWKLTCDSIHQLILAGFDEQKIVVVDDGSDDDSAEKMISRFPSCIYLIKKKNGGYCKAFNSGFKEAIKLGADIIFWAQNDSHTYSSNIVSRAKSEFENDNKLGLLGTKILDPKGNIRWDSKMKNRMGIDYNISEGFFVSAEAFNSTGGLDERFNVYFEDIDFFIRVSVEGFTTKVIDDVSWVHIAGVTLRKKIFKPTYLRTKNLFLIIKKHSFHKGFYWACRLILGETFSHIKVTNKVHSLSLIGWISLISGIFYGSAIGVYYWLFIPRFKKNSLSKKRRLTCK